MRVWTIQAPEVLAALRAGNDWRADARSCDPSWAHAYRWMAAQMATRLGAPVMARQMPVWLWCQWRGAARPRPDLRTRGHLPSGTVGVRLELELHGGRVLESDFDLWHYALNGWYLPCSLGDERRFDASPDPKQIPASWERMFDAAWSNRRYRIARAERSIQGVTWELRPGDLRRAVTFVAR